MKKYLKYIVICIILIALFVVIFGVTNFRKKDETPSEQENVEYIPQEDVNIDKNQIAYQENTTIQDLKEEVGATGEENIYDVTTEYDGRKILSIKPNVQFNVVLAGILDNKQPENNLESLAQKGTSFLGKKGIWIEKNSRQAFLDILSETTKNEYMINEDGYVACESKENANELDKKIEQILDGDDLYIIAITGTCYILDEISGEIVEYPFEKMDPYQTCEFYENGNQKIFVLTTNERQKITSEEIMNSVFEFM